VLCCAVRLGEEERKAAQAARQARELENKKATLGSTLAMFGLGQKGFGSMGKAATRTGGWSGNGVGVDTVCVQGDAVSWGLQDAEE
jgi:hypothetical protein